MPPEKKESQEKSSSWFKKLRKIVVLSLTPITALGALFSTGISHVPKLAEAQETIQTYWPTRLPPIEDAPSRTKLQNYKISLIQMILRQLDFNPGPIDGTLGPNTREALRKFQISHALAVTGQADDKTLEALGLKKFTISRFEDFLFSHDYVFYHEVKMLDV